MRVRFYLWLERHFQEKRLQLQAKKYYKTHPEHFQAKYVEKRYVYRMDKMLGKSRGDVRA